MRRWEIKGWWRGKEMGAEDMNGLEEWLVKRLGN